MEAVGGVIWKQSVDERMEDPGGYIKIPCQYCVAGYRKNKGKE